MKSGKIYYIIGIILLLIIIVFFVKDKFMNNNVISVRCNNKIVTLSKSDKKMLNNYLKNENFSKDESAQSCNINGTYVIEYDNISLKFDDNNCSVFLNNNKTFENYNTSLSNDLINYVKNICN